MVAQNMLPKNPLTRDFIETTLHENPSILRFLDRIQQHALEIFAQPTFQIRRLDFDEWDPPLALQITAEIPEETFVDQLHDLYDWIRADPDHDERLIQTLLLRRAPGRNDIP